MRQKSSESSASKTRKWTPAQHRRYSATMRAKREGKPEVVRDVNLHAMAKRVYIAYKAELGKTGELTDLIVASHVLCKAILGE